MTKPPYKPPMTVKQLRARKRNGIKVASTFSGGGGSSTGYRMAGASVLWCNEFVEAARETYAANWPDTFINAQDIRSLSADDIRNESGADEIDVLDGSPPCSSFSMAGARTRLWGEAKKYSDTEQRTDDLFYEFARILDELRPRSFIAENVPGMRTGKARGYFLEVLDRLKACGYRVEARVISAHWLGVPQHRQRLIFMGIRDDLNRDPLFPTPDRHYYTIRDCIPWLEDPNYVPTEGSWVNPERDMARKWKRLALGELAKNPFQLRRSHPDLPAYTVTAATARAAGIMHPFQCRKFDVPETKRICSFPDDYVLTGNFAKQIERLGRAVPPVMMMRIAEKLFEVIS